MLEGTDRYLWQVQGAPGQVQWQLPVQSWHTPATKLKGESMPSPCCRDRGCAPVVHVDHVQRRRPWRQVLLVRRRPARRRASAAAAPCGAASGPQAAAQRLLAWRRRGRAVCAARRLSRHLQSKHCLPRKRPIKKSSAQEGQAQAWTKLIFDFQLFRLWQVCSRGCHAYLSLLNLLDHRLTVVTAKPHLSYVHAAARAQQAG